MEAKTFILTKTKTWKREVRVFIMNQNKKYIEKLLPFTTEHVVSTKQRNTRGHIVPAQFVTSDPVIIEALYRDPAYGKDFIEVGDAEGKKKQPSIVINESDRQLVALRGLFKLAELPMDETLPYDVLKEQYEIHMTAISGKNKESKPAEIPHAPIDVKASIEQGVAAARQKYEDDYGDPIPAIVANDLAFLDGLSNPNFDAQKYIEEMIAKANVPEEEVKEQAKEQSEVKSPAEEKEALHKAYFEKTGKNVPNMKSNDLAWIKAKLEE
ncbi:MAG: hypothetical protein PHT07_20920 [Paludibacter sp.]|nr:hypothetical protein [Paludibacter sp.]